MPYNSETSQYERRATTVIDATPDGDTVAVAIDVKLDQAADDYVTDLNHHDANGNHYPDPAVTVTKQYLAKSPAGSVSWANGVPLDQAVESALLAASDGADLVGYGAGATVKDALDARPTSATLAASGGSNLVGFLQDGTGAVARTAQDKFRDVVTVKDFGAVGDGVTDDTLAVQAAINEAAATGKTLRLVSGDYRVTATLEVVNSIRMVGDGVDIGSDYGTVPVVRGPGSWLFFDHTGVGILTDKGVGKFGVGAHYEKFGTYRTQPSPGDGTAAWTPTAHDWDFLFDSYDATMRDMMLLNPTKGVKLQQGNAGRLSIYNLRSQALYIGIDIEESYDVCRLENIHLWPFWCHAQNVCNYMLKNAVGVRSGRNDNPLITNLFTIFYGIGLLIYGTVTGTTNKLKLVNADFDRGGYGVAVADGADGFIGTFTNVSIQSETGGLFVARSAFTVFANYCDIVIASPDIREATANAVRVNGTGNIVTITDGPLFQNWDRVAVGFPAVEAAAGNIVNIESRIRKGTGGAYLFGGAGTIRYPGLITQAAVAFGAAETTKTVAHGLPKTPGQHQVIVWYTTGKGASIGVRAQNFTATTFDIVLEVAPGAPIAVGWRAQLS